MGKQQFNSLHEAYTFLLIAQQDIRHLVLQNEQKLESFLNIVKDESLSQESQCALAEMETFSKLSEQIKSQAIDLDKMVKKTETLLKNKYIKIKKEADN